MRSRRITITIGRVVIDAPGLDRAALRTAIEAEVRSVLEERGVNAFGPGRAVEAAIGRTAENGGGGAATAVARAAVGVLTP